MSNELYYRGSSTYEVAVKNKLDALERSGTRNAAAMMAGLRNMEYGIRSDIRESTYAIVASQEMLAQTYKQGFDSVNNTLDLGFEKMAFGMNNIANGMNDIANSISAMSDAICSKLDELHGIMSNPRLTAARELFRRAADNFEKGYFEEALEDCKQAVEKEKTDFISWFLLGQIYLYGAGKFSNVINLPEAEKAFLNAAKYIDADLGNSNEARQLASQIYYYLGQTKYFLSNDLLVKGKKEESTRKLVEAEKNTSESIRLDGKNSKVLYDNVKQLHFLGKDKEALKILKGLIRQGTDFAVFSLNDKNLKSIWSDIEKMILELRDELFSKIKSQLTSNFDNAANSDYYSSSQVDFEIFQEKFQGLLGDIKNADYYSVIEFYNETLPDLESELDEIVSSAKEFKYVRDQIKESVNAVESQYNSNPKILRDFVLEYGYIPVGITVIKERLFEECDSLQNIEISSSVTRIENCAFSSCKNLKNVKLPNSLVSIGERAFHICDSLTDINIPDTVTEIGEFAFSCCNSLRKIKLSSALTEIKDWAFESCGFSSINIPNGVKKIGESAFRGSKLTEIVLPDSVTEIDNNAFCSCRNLRKITFGNSKIKFGKEVFKYCPNLDKETLKKIKEVSLHKMWFI